MDGTILDTEHVWEKTNTHLLELCNITSQQYVGHPVFEDLSGKNYQECLRLLREAFAISHDTGYLEQEFITISQRLLAQDLRFIEGFEAFHKKLSDNGILTGLATNCEPQSLRKLTTQMNLSLFFGTHVYCIEHVNNKPKPDPAMFLHTAAQLNVAPSECIVFEDSLAGFQAASGANMSCVAVKNKYNQKFFAQHTKAGITNYYEAEDALKILLGIID